MHFPNVQIGIFQSCLNKVPTYMYATYLKPSFFPHKRKQWTFLSTLRYGTCHYMQGLYFMACTVPKLYSSFLSPKTPLSRFSDTVSLKIMQNILHNRLVFMLQNYMNLVCKSSPFNHLFHSFHNRPAPYG